MPRYFFDLQYSELDRDDTGTEFASLDEVRRAALKLIPEVAREEIAKDGQRTSFTVLVTDEGGRAVYAASLNITDLWLCR